MKHVIIGNGPAGVIAAETIRKHSKDDQIVLIGDEPEPSYSRMAIPYLLIGNIDERGTYLRKEQGHFERLRIEEVRGRVSSLDAAGKTVKLEDGSSIGFDRCLIATGSVPITPPIPGVNGPGVHACWTLEDARRIQELAQPGARVIQMGAGFIGCIIMEALAARGVDLTVVEMGDRMVPRMMGEGAGNMIKNWCEKKGIRVYTSTRVEAIERARQTNPAAAGAPAEAGTGANLKRLFGIGNGEAGQGAGNSDAAGSASAPMQVRLSNGTTLGADLVISATGVKPNIGFLKDSGLKTAQGILVDAAMQSSVPGIYAAGDCAEAFDDFSGKTLVSAIQPNAADQATCAAINMTGRTRHNRDVTQINVLDTLGLISTSFGRWDGAPGGEYVELSDPKGFRFMRLEFDGDTLVGSNTIGHTEHIGVLRGLIQQRVSLGEWKDKLLADPGLLMEAYIARSQAQDAWQGR